MKRIVSILMAAVLLVSAIPTAFAAEGEHDYSNGTQITLVGTQENQGAQWTVTVPAKMQPGQTGTVKAEGTWAADQFINVHAPQSVTLTYGAQTMDVAVTLGKDHGFAKIGSNTEEVTHSAEITVAEASRLFGTWEGIIEYEVAMITNGDVNRDGMITADDASMMQKAGLDFIELTEEQARYADLDGDGIASSQDGALCLRIIDNYCANTAVNAVQPVELISFTIDSTEYQAEEGMTWAQWLNSDYNTDGYYVSAEDGIWHGYEDETSSVYTEEMEDEDGFPDYTYTLCTDTIIANHDYFTI